MKRLALTVITAAVLLSVVLPIEPAHGRPGFTKPVTINLYSKPVAGYPNVSIERHKINRLALAVTNNGFFGTGSYGSNPIDPETGLTMLACEYPINSNVEYLWVGALWFGAVVGRDTLVSVGAGMYYFDMLELWPDEGEAGRMIRRSTQPYSHYYSVDAVSEEDIIAEYCDTLTNTNFVSIDPYDNRPHQPLGIKITQKSYAWSYPYAEDFILFDFNIENIGPFPLKQFYIGIAVDADAYHTSNEGSSGSWLDDICGYREVFPSTVIPNYDDSIRVAWVADNDGDPNPGVGAYDFSSCTGVTGIRIIRTPSDSLEYSFNWWVTGYTPSLDWGPRQTSTDKPYRDFGPNFGSPLGDRNKYYMLSTREFDYDQLEAAMAHSSEGWMNPPARAEDFADGHNSIYLFSFGPFDVAPGETLPVTLAYVGGEDFHHDPDAFEDLYQPHNPGPYQDQLDFTSLGLNATWADWIYDNPGYDTDNNGDSGGFLWKCEWADSTAYYTEDEFPDDSSSDLCEKVFISGDDEPDFRGAAPPPAPILNVSTDFSRLIVRWNGQLTENSIDVFSKKKDFEGYKVYYGEDNRLSDFVLLATYDRRNYNLYYWDEVHLRWEVTETPLDYDSLVTLFGKDFDPDQYSEQSPLATDHPRNSTGRYIYFIPQNWNESDLSDPYRIHRIYPDADPDDPTDTTAAGNHRFYEYEYIIDNISPTRPVYVSVTAFDYGSRTHYLSALETSPLTNAVYAWPQTSSEEVERDGLGVTVYPNPYRIDGGYAQAGFENRDRTKSAERTRKIHFANLPARCTIRIFTLNGDLVQKIEHDYGESGPESMHATWNLISRNTQAVTTGIYIWSVTSDMGEQLGKLVIMK
ncbi:MAG: hypothetical protein GY841_13685 [FCB group bacterium]|nr:hypothetical protein [FCB group bacterium]